MPRDPCGGADAVSTTSFQAVGAAPNEIRHGVRRGASYAATAASGRNLDACFFEGQRIAVLSEHGFEKVEVTLPPESRGCFT